MMLDEVFVEKDQIAKDIKDELTKSMSAFGFSIIQALVNDIGALTALYVLYVCSPSEA